MPLVAGPIPGHARRGCGRAIRIGIERCAGNRSVSTSIGSLCRLPHSATMRWIDVKGASACRRFRHPVSPLFAGTLLRFAGMSNTQLEYVPQDLHCGSALCDLRCQLATRILLECLWGSPKNRGYCHATHSRFTAPDGNAKSKSMLVIYTTEFSAFMKGTDRPLWMPANYRITKYRRKTLTFKPESEGILIDAECSCSMSARRGLVRSSAPD